MGALGKWLVDKDVTRTGKNKGNLRGGMTKDGMKLELYVGPREGYGAILLFATGSPALNVYSRGIASRQGWKLSQYGLFDMDGKLVCDCTREYPILERLDLVSYIDPVKREMK